ncbi:hypothetical protein IFT84_20690 [Rhizobium sp. CFBP 8762]|uniref:HEPN domain-containing protein n=1 Tax=Rhizobium sp. CFBP 8762 TaxID=2775279 RepID=UPI00177AB6E7|nr:HEPN domain-containing protein [Rhizobium sp. CFBP 8762]MBD8556931.1 hypothetical protein [Rhizobium sp. CFBP 8762]
MAVVDNIYDEFQDAVAVLKAANEISLHVMLEANLRKTLLLGAASYFEVRLIREVGAFTDEITSGNELIRALVQQKAISRQYHTWFEWDKPNANKFFGMFGETFKNYMTTKVASDADLAKSVKSFLKIGSERNRLVHGDYASLFIDLTPTEIYELYQSANSFVDLVGQELRTVTASIIAAAAGAATFK